MRKVLSLALVACAVVLVGTGNLQAALPDVGVDISTATTDLGASLGTYVGGAIAIGFAFFAIFRGVQAIRKYTKS